MSFDGIYVSFIRDIPLKVIHSALKCHISNENIICWYLYKESHKHILCKHLIRLAPVLKSIFINLSYHILVASLTLMALF